jgi:hypothetical protein
MNARARTTRATPRAVSVALLLLPDYAEVP